MLIRKKFYQPLTDAKNFVDYAEMLAHARKVRIAQALLTRFQEGFVNLIRHGHFSVDDVHHWVENKYRADILAKHVAEFRAKSEKAQADAVTQISNHIHERLEQLFPKAITSADGVEEVVVG